MLITEEVKVMLKTLKEDKDVLKQMQQIEHLSGFDMDIVGKDYLQKNFRV